MTRNTIRIAGASGFWGDSSIAVPQLLRAESLDYIVFDYLAEITMSIMARARAKDASAGCATDFIGVVARHARAIAERKIKIISNAGGVNPRACAEALQQKLADAGVKLRIGIVLGDDLLDRADEFRAAGTREMFCGVEMPENLWSMNAYLGAGPIAAALDNGADIVITGRCVDSAVTLGACMHAFGWRADELDRLAAGSLAGHILECGAQATGGLHTDWEETGDWADIGYPIVDVSSDGSFVLSKPEGTGGLVNFATVAEQMLYEIGDPRAYVLPDVTCDFSGVRIDEIGRDRVRVSDAKGLPPTDTYKTSATYQEGYRVGAYLTIGGIDAARKAEKVADAVIRRCGTILKAINAAAYSETSVEVLGAEASYGPHSRARASREVVLKLAAKHSEPKPLELLVRELTSSGTSMSPGITGMGGNRAKVSPVVRLFSCLVPKDKVPIAIEVDGVRKNLPNGSPHAEEAKSLRAKSGTPDFAGAVSKGEAAPPANDSPFETRAAHAPQGEGGAMATVPLVALAWARSGDKGNNSNIGVIARKPEYLPIIRNALTSEAVANYFAHHVESRRSEPVERYDVPGIRAINFLLHDVLGGGGIASLRNDPQGKGFAQMLLDFPIPVDERLASELASRTDP
ncbi:MAG TPA: acyclic terpene utilization AtuA family protein [Beijerinckiaceae bacterium]|nr:acyclic terpene utilization AtuA family protein [Beijerinckiaceae bacterium]